MKNDICTYKNEITPKAGRPRKPKGKTVQYRLKSDAEQWAWANCGGGRWLGRLLREYAERHGKGLTK